MRYRVTCAVDSATYIDAEFNVEVDDLVCTFTPDEHGRLVRIAITAPVPDVEKFRSEIIENPRPGVKAHFIHNTDKQLFDRLISEFQRLESHISFSFRLDAIRWQHPKTETICENDAEREIAKIFASELTLTPRENPVKVSAEAMAKLIVGSRRYDQLTVPMSFYREGMNEFRERRYVTSFFNFYFIVEGLFGRGKTKNYQIEHEFKKSAGFRWALESTLENLRKEHEPIWNRLTEEFSRVGRSLDIDGMIEHLVSTRGRLHHFTHNPNRLEGTPFTDPAFEPIAEVARGVATFGIYHYVVEINNGRDPAA
jgi:hypothetical protein